MVLNPILKRLIGCIGVFLSFYCIASNALALEPEHEAERLLIATEQAFTNNDISQVERNLEQVRLLHIALPPDYQFFNGKLLLHKKSYTSARIHLENYVNLAGKEGHHYREALTLITQIEKAAQQPAAKTTTSHGKSKADISWSEDNSDYVQKLLKIYDTSIPERALTRHINSLLKFYAYSDDRIIASSRMTTPSLHQLHTSGRGEIVSMNKIGAGSDIPFTENRFSVYGVNPYVSYRCYQNSANCWLQHPVTQERWLQIVNNDDAAQEVAKALSHLIKDMQNSG